MSKFNSDVTTLINMPSNADGSFRENNWLSRLRSTGIEIIQDNAGQTVYKLEGEQFIVNPAIDTLLSFDGLGFTGNRQSNITAIKESLKLRAEGFVTLLQKQAAGADNKQTPAVLESDEKLLTSQQYKDFVLGERENYKQSLLDAFELLTKSELFTSTWIEQGLKRLEGFKVEFNANQQEIYDSKVESETKAAERMKVLTDAGFSKIMPCIGYKDAEGKSRKFTGFQATVDLKNHTKLERQTALLETNYIPVYSVAESETSGIIYFKESVLEDSLI
jgi:hypothetical protein